MPRRRKVTKSTQTDDDLFERRLAALEELTQKLQGKIADLISNVPCPVNEKDQSELTQQLEGKIDSLSSEMNSKFVTTHNMMYEDKEILLGLEQEVEVSIPEKIVAVQDEVTSKISSVEENIRIIKYREGKNRDEFNSNLKQNTASIDAIEQELKSRNVIVFGIPEENTEVCLGRLEKYSCLRFHTEIFFQGRTVGKIFFF